MIILRRSLLSSLMMLSITPAVAAIPSLSSTPDCAPPASVSPRMAALIADFVRLNAVLDAVDADADPMAADRAAAARGPALDALVFHRPVSVMDLAAKMSALIEFVPEDSERFVLRMLAEDAAILAGSAQ